MAIKRGDKYYCSYCHNEYTDPVKADTCRENHDLIYVAISRSDLNRLIQYIHLGNQELLTPTLIKTLNKYLRGN